ncbi:hypothetical protein CBS147325_8741 [Penicillium roqueforti]|nr:hypothetical protein CBS147325_8741 [Penicillium roqueforti]KAI3150485.1 hypothetical protein DTO046C5_9512 [Penicillium roqueforti]
MKQHKIQNMAGYRKRGIITLPNKSHHVIREPDMKKEVSFNQDVFNLSLALSQSRINDVTELRGMVLDVDGSVKQSEIRGTRDEIAKRWGLDGRDLRNVDLVSEGIPHLLVRPSVIFISMFTLRLLVRTNGVLLFLLPIENSHVKVQDVFMTDLQGRLQPCPGSGLLSKLPFELRVVDAALASVIATLEAEHILIRREAEESLQDSTREDVVYSVLRGLQNHKKRLVAIQQRARQFRSALREILENDEDMATMFLTDREAGQPHEVDDHQEVEYLLEAYYKSTDAIAESASALLGDLERTTETIQSILDVRRNQILVFEAQLEICMLGFAVSTFVAGLFGMNVTNFFEDSPSAFAILVGTCIIGTVTIAKVWGISKPRRKDHPLLILNWAGYTGPTILRFPASLAKPLDRSDIAPKGPDWGLRTSIHVVAGISNLGRGLDPQRARRTFAGSNKAVVPAIVLPLANIIMIAKLLLIFEIMYVTTVATTKISILLMYCRIFPTREIRIASLVLGGMTLSWLVAIILVSVFQCNPIPRAWDTRIPGKCINLKGMFIGNAVPNILTDILILSLPVKVVWGLHASLTHRLVVFTSAYRFATIFGFDPTDIAWTLGRSCTWCVVESSTGIISACMPTLRPLFMIFSSKFSSRSGTRSRTTDLDQSKGYELDNSALRPANEPRNKTRTQLEVSHADDGSEDEVPLNSIRVQQYMTWQESRGDSFRGYK